MAAFCAVIPIDAISKASESNNYALNTFVVVGALVLFGIISAITTTARFFVLRKAMLDIPKRYVPLDADDMPRRCHEMIEANFTKCEHVRQLALRVPKVVKHPGLSGPESDTLPPLIRFDDAVRAIGLKLKWDNGLLRTRFHVPENLTMRETLAFLELHKVITDPVMCRDYVALYEELRYSGKLITEEKFIRFMELSVSFVNSLYQHTDMNLEDDSQSEFAPSREEGLRRRSGQTSLAVSMVPSTATSNSAIDSLFPIGATRIN